MAFTLVKKRARGREIQEAVGGDRITETWIAVSDNVNETQQAVYDAVPVNVLDSVTNVSDEGEPVGIGENDKYSDLYCISKSCALEKGSRTHWIVTCVYARQMSPCEPIRIKTGTWTLRKTVTHARVYRPDGTLTGGDSILDAVQVDLDDQDPVSVRNVVGDPYANAVIEDFPQGIITYNWKVPLSVNSQDDVLMKFMDLKDEMEGTMNSGSFSLLNRPYGNGQVKLQRMNASLIYPDFNEKADQLEYSASHENPRVLLDIEMQFYTNTYAEKISTLVSGDESASGWFILGWYRAIAELGYREWKKYTAPGTGEEEEKLANIVNSGDKQKSNSPLWLDDSGKQLSDDALKATDPVFPYSIWQTLNDKNFDELLIFGLPSGTGSDSASTQKRKKPEI